MAATATSAARTRTTERRRHRRVPMVCDIWERQPDGPEVACRLAGHFGLAGKTLNLSDGGAKIRLSRSPERGQLEVGATIALTLALPRSTADTFLIEHRKLAGRVVRIETACEDGPVAALAVRFDGSADLQVD